MLRSLFLFLAISVLLNASWIDDCGVGRCPVPDDSYHAFVALPIDSSDYRDKALDQGLADLSKQLYSVVRSQTASDTIVVDDTLKDHFAQTLLVVSDLKLHGYRTVKEERQNGKYYLLMVLNPADARPYYAAQAETLAKETDDAMRDARSATSRQAKARLLRRAQSAFINYGKHAKVASLLGAKKGRAPKSTAYAIDDAMAQLDRLHAADTHELAELLIKRLDRSTLKRVTVFAPAFEDSDSYSPFSADLKASLTSAFKRQGIRVSTSGAPVTVTGHYSLPAPRQLRAHLQVVDATGEVIATSEASMRITDFARYRPKKNDYPTLQQTVIDSKLSVQGRINGKTRDLLLKDGDPLDIQFKVSREAYVYIVANMRYKGKQVQYLLSMSDAAGSEQFRRYVPPHQAGMWISIAPPEDPFTVMAPFGSERFQFFASSKDILNDLPRHSTDSIEIDGSDYIGVILDENAQLLDAGESIAQTRGVGRNRKQKDKQFAMSEYVLSFTTMRK